MNLEEYKKRIQMDEKWLPGLDAIDAVFNKLYTNMECTYYGNIEYKMTEEKLNQALYGVSIYESENGYKHLVTHGMSEIYADEEFFGKEYSGWGYEMTIKIKEESDEDCLWAIEMLSQFAAYTYENKIPLESMQYVTKEEFIFKSNDVNISGVLIVNDTEIKGIETIHGRIEFLQIILLNEDELNAIKEDNRNAIRIIENMKKDSPYLVSNRKRKETYI